MTNSIMPNRSTQMLIIGSGPAGLTAAIYGGRAGLKPIVAAGSISGSTMPGGQLMITTEVENYPGFPEGIAGPDLMNKLFDQAKRFDSEIIESFATQFTITSKKKFLVKVGEEIIEAKCVILANGAAARWLNLPREDEYKNRGISACATCDGPLPAFRDTHLFVVGGGDSACEEALFLTKFASKVSIVHRRDQLRASKIMASRAMAHPKIEMVWNSTIVSYSGEGKLEGITLKNLQTGINTDVKCGGLFMAIGHTPNTTALQDTKIELDDQGYVKVRDHVYTNIEGVFTAGDCHDTIYRQAITAAGFGCMAAITAERWLEENHRN